MVHKDCRRLYTHPDYIKKRQTSDHNDLNSSLELRSQVSPFMFCDHCLFCGKPAKHNHRKRGADVFPVRTFDFRNNVLKTCYERNDNWATEVRARIEVVNDLQAADAIYHQSCNVNFRTGKSCPLVFSDQSSSSRFKKGRPSNSECVFQKIFSFFDDNEDEQITVSNLVEKMTDFGGDACSTKYLKKRLKDHYKDGILITDIIGKPSVVTLRESASSILQKFYERPEEQDSRTEKMSIIKTAADLLKSDIRCIETNRDTYPLSIDVSSVEKNLQYIPESLRVFLHDLFSEKDAGLKISSIGQAMMQASRPRALIAPLQLGLGIQMHHGFASKYLIETLHSLGFSSSYPEVQKFEACAASQRVLLPEQPSESFIQFVGDNVDHNLHTLDGYNTFHGMGMIASVTPGSMTSVPIERKPVSFEEIKLNAKVDIHYYKQSTHQAEPLVYKELREIDSVNKHRTFDHAFLLTWSLRAPTPSWSGLMQMVHEGSYPGKSAIYFLPMIDMNPSDLTCVYSTMTFISELAYKHNTTPVLTFDQPFYWKAKLISQNCEDGDPVRDKILRIGGFHLKMSYLGCIGHIMSGSGLKEVMELIYAPNAVSHILTGKAVARAVRAHMLVDTALHSHIFVDTISGHHLQDTSSNETEKQTDMKAMADLLDDLASGKQDFDTVLQSDTMLKAEDMFVATLDSFSGNRTAALWIQYSSMIELLRMFTRAERKGDWKLHLKCIKDMVCFLAAAGHNLYVKSAYMYLQSIQQLHRTHPDVYAAFTSGHHVIRRSDRCWAGLSSDLVIEQVLMRSLKSAGGMTRGRKMGEQQRALWVMSIPACAAMNEAMQSVSDVSFQSSEQHKVSTEARQSKDYQDVTKIREFFKERSPITSRHKS